MGLFENLGSEIALRGWIVLNAFGLDRPARALVYWLADVYQDHVEGRQR